jgi:septin family protein
MDGLLSPDPLDISLKKNGHRGPPLMASDDCLNIPLLGATGIGKSTFINTFVNYLTFDTLNNALNGEMQTLIYSTFSTSTEDDEETEIVVGVPDDREGTTLETRVVLIPKVAELTQFQMETGQYG